ncbi:Lipoyltransferase and lipoate-protein ligase [Lactarius psammicola]|nr:Lipoyltransferase and lipoate-protein ligase [Lactarius psammicola]
MISTLTRLLPRSPRRRHFSTSLPLSLTAKHSIYVSQSSDPYFNLTFEDWYMPTLRSVKTRTELRRRLFKEKPTHEPLLLIYRDRPCVVIGRNQNPWKEVNFHELHCANIPFIRRRSGGGTVYHDMGNTNFSIHLPRGSFDRNVTAELVLRAVRSLNIDARVNERNDVCVGPYKMSFLWAIEMQLMNERGPSVPSRYNAYIVSAQHPGQRIARLKSTQEFEFSCYIGSQDSMVTRGVASVRSPVKNLREFSPTVTHDTFVKAMVQAFREEYHVKEPVQYVQASDATDSPYIQNGITELHVKTLSPRYEFEQDWNWAFGQTPEFTYSISRTFGWGNVTAKIHSKHGVILSCSLTAEDMSDAMKLEKLGHELEGQKYGFLDKGTTYDGCGRIQEVRQWLIEEMSG